jgi:hypothetical protein
MRWSNLLLKPKPNELSSTNGSLSVAQQQQQKQQPGMKDTKTPFIRPTLRGLVLVLAALALSTQVVRATPFASCITNNGNTIYFYLNEGGGSVTVTYDNGSTNANFADVVLAAGQYNFDLTGHSSYTITVSKIGTGTPTLLTSVARTTPRGIAANMNGASPYFGYVYSEIGGQGVVIMHSDGSGGGANNPFAGTSLTPAGSGVTWSANTYGQDRIAVAPDDYVLVSDYTTADGGIIRVNPTFTSSQLLLAGQSATSANHGTAESRAIQTGTIGNNANLYVVDGSFQLGAVGTTNPNNILTYNIGSGALPWATAPNTIGAAVNPTGVEGVGSTFFCGLSRGNNGYFYVAVERSLGNGNNNATYGPLGDYQVWAADAQTLLWNSYISSTADIVVTTGTENGILPSDSDLSPDNTTVAIVHLDNHFTILGLTNGVPDSSTLYTFAGPGTTGNGRGICFDAAGNLWMSSSGLGSVYQYSLGKTATAVTTGNASGPTSFNLVTPATVTVAAAVNSTVGPIASQNNTYGNPGFDTFTLTRSTSVGQLQVGFTLGGTATNGVYTTAPGAYTTTGPNSITFLNGQTTTNITITAVNDSVPRLTTSVTLSIQPSPTCNVGLPGSATIYIVNTAFPTLVLTNFDTQMYERTNDYARFQVTRLGDTNIPLSQVNLAYSGGTAAYGVNYYGPSTMYMLQGDVSDTFQVFPIHDGVHTGNLTVGAQVTAATDASYHLGGVTSATVTLVDSDDPPETVLWEDTFSTDTSANWKVLFGSTNGAPQDYCINEQPDGNGTDPLIGTWPFDYSALHIPPAPHTTDGSTLGLYMTVNKEDGIPVAAGLNLYPKGQSFSGNYALRFDMFLTVNNSTATTEYALMGVNHSGNDTNWFRFSTGGMPATSQFDGIFYDIESDAADLGEYVAFSSPYSATALGPTPVVTGVDADGLTNVFKSPPWIFGAVGGGAPANTYGGTTPIWADVEIKQLNGILYFSVNHTLIFSYTNTTAYTSGDIMLGYCDAYDSIGSQGGSVVYDNVRVISLENPVITNIVLNAGAVTIDFVANAGDVTTQFALQQSTPLVSGPYADTAAPITSLGGGAFKAVLSAPASTTYYRIRRIY